MNQLILELAAVNKLKLSEAETAEICDAFTSFTADFDAMAAVETGDLEPLVYLVSMNNIFRKDIAKHKISRERLLQTAPEHQNGGFVVPKIVE